MPFKFGNRSQIRIWDLGRSRPLLFLPLERNDIVLAFLKVLRKREEYSDNRFEKLT